MVFGISGGGRSAEDLFRQLTGAGRAESAAVGDAVLSGHLVEIKSATKVTLNQVRAVKYLPLVVYFQPTETWYVIPPQVVVAMVSGKIRGQHTENPFESATLNLSTLSAYRVTDPEKNLGPATIRAVEQGDRYPELRKAM